MPLFADLDYLRADLDALRPLAHEQELRVLQKFRLEWNYNSNAIEGNSLTLGETRSLLLHGLTAAGKPIRDHLDIKGHNEAVVALEEFVRSEYPLTEQFIREMHQLLLGEAYEVPAQTASGQPTRKLIVPGRYKTSPNNVLTATGEMFYFASVEETPGRMTDLVDWYRAEEAAPTMHPAALAAEFHYRFVRIHPFDDGNGRMSRLLMNLILLRHGYPMTVIQAADRNRYLAALAEADAGEPEPFLRFIIENVEASLRLMIRAARGEFIDEPSDLDKKWSLLKKQVLENQNTPLIYWDIVSQNNFYDNFLIYWLTDILSSIKPVDSFFNINSLIFGHLDINSSHKSETAYAASIVDNTRATFRTSRKLFKYITYIFTWLESIQPINKFNFRLIVKVEFHKDVFTILYKLGETVTASKYDFWPEILKSEPLLKEENWLKLFSCVYKINFTHIQVHEINYQLANKVYEFIAAKLADAYTPPA